MSWVTTISCGLKWNPYYLDLREVKSGGCLPGGSVLIRYWNKTAGIVEEVYYGVMCGGNGVSLGADMMFGECSAKNDWRTLCGSNVLLGTALICTFRIIRIGASIIDLYGMSCWDMHSNEILKGDSPYDCTISMIQWPSPVGGSSLSVVEPTLGSHAATYFTLIAAFGGALSLRKRKGKADPCARS